MLIAALFTIAKIWIQSKCLFVDEWIKQLWDISTMECCSTIKKKKKKNVPFVMGWVDLEIIMLI